MRTLFGIAIIAVALIITTWSVEPTIGKTPTVSVDPLGLMATTSNTASALPRFQHHLLTDRAGPSILWLAFCAVVISPTGAPFYTVTNCYIVRGVTSRAAVRSMRPPLSSHLELASQSSPSSPQPGLVGRMS
jgi:hypothetical protein